MIHFEYLSDQEGAGRYGNCASCGKFYNEDPKMIRLTFIRDDSSRGHEICLCDECRELLCPEIILCKECVYRFHDAGYGRDWCNRTTGVFRVTEDDFCSYAERKTDD